MLSLKERLELLMKVMSWEHADLVRESGESSSVVSQWLGKGSKEIKSIGKMEAAERLEVATGFCALWIAKGKGAQRVSDPRADNAPYTVNEGVAHYSSLKAATVDKLCPTAWEALMKIGDRAELPEYFSTEMPDDSMAPRVRAGAILIFDRDVEPRPGDGILLRDRDGEQYFRLFKQRSKDVWEAHALNEAYPALESERDGLELLAVLTGVKSRWG